MIEISEVTKIFKNKEGDLHAVNQVSLSIGDGQIYGIEGYSGAANPPWCAASTSWRSRIPAASASAASAPSAIRTAKAISGPRARERPKRR